ncbi:MAG: SUMF1/EgtB/PvdO family nonheme iron enzyme [Phycisphaerae bacterium]|nr:SUMF1/EgtB/PvdO family nonheme iron enzyme [Phycisphaerae bacterium]
MTRDGTSERTYKVFVSSTYLDNQERRQIVEEAILQADMMPIGMERFTASTTPTMEACLDYVKQADALLGIVAHRYGWMPEGQDASITELEYGQARERLMFEIDPSLPVAPGDFDAGPDRWKKQDKLDAFKARFRRDQMAAPFTDNTLGQKVLAALLQWKKGRDLGAHERLRRDYLEELKAQTHRIDIQGILSESGAGRQPVYFPIEEHYTPLQTGSDSPARVSDIGRGGPSERVPLTDLLSRHRRLLIVGDPGGGKTTFLRFIACVLAKDGLDPGKSRRHALLGLADVEAVPVPILVSVARLVAASKDGGRGAAWCALPRALADGFGAAKADLLTRFLDQDRCVVLLDGLDEVADPALRTRMADMVNALVHHWRNNLFVITSRPFGYQAVAGLEGMATAHICAFEKPEIVQFMQRWATALYPDEQERGRNAYLPQLQAAVLNVPHIRRMAQNPVMLTCLCVVHWNERHLPEGKADLLMAVLRWLLYARDEKRRDRGYTSTFAGECFKELALAMTTAPEGKQVTVDLAWAAEQLGRPFLDERDVKPDHLRREGVRFLEAEMVDSGIVCQDSTGRLRFWHLTFQEHYAGKALSELGDGEEGWWAQIAPHADDEQWKEVIDHFAGCLAKTGRRGLYLLVERILGQAKEGDLAATARAVGILGRLLHILAVYDYQPPARLGWDETRDRVLAIFTREGAQRVPWRQRLAAAEALGKAGDPRLARPEPAMLPVPGVKGILLGRYPVTVDEYRRFVDNGGYGQERFWGDSWSIKAREGWDAPDHWDDQLEHLSRPVTGVSWYEARAYCQWLRESTELPYRLPTEEEWAAAATNPQGDYPWGNEPANEELLNFGHNVGAPSPVGMYPAGAGPGGHLDMAGNVWEWCSDLFGEKSTVKDPNAPPFGSVRVLRGGAWINSPWFCRSAYRYCSAPVARNDYIGFRVVSVSFGLGPSE